MDILMKNSIFIFLLSCILFSCKTETNSETEIVPKPMEKAEFSIVIHGGAGYIKKDNISDEKEAAYRQKLGEAIRVGYNILKDGGTSLDAVQKAINILEDSQLFNSGKGAVFTNEGTC